MDGQKNLRNRAFMDAIDRAISESSGNISLTRIIAQVIKSPTESFFLSVPEILRIFRGGCLNCSPLVNELRGEILLRRNEIIRNNRKLNGTDVARIISAMPAPRFYISLRRAVRLHNHLLKNPPQV